MRPNYRRHKYDQGRAAIPQFKHQHMIAVQAELAAEREAARLARIEGCKKASKIVGSNVGLCIIVALYAVAGGFLFQILEQTNEQEECVQAGNRYYPMINNTANRLWTISAAFDEEEDYDLVVIEFQKQVRLFRDDVIALGYRGENCSAMGKDGGPQYQWNLPGSLLFSVTVFTTIGYGNIAPKTFWGRLVCIAYAVVGIPLMLLCLANLGEIMADIFRFIYSKVCCCGCLRKSKPAKGEDEKRDKETDTGPEAWKDRYEAQKAAGGGPGMIGPNQIEDDDEDEDEDEEERVSVPLTVTMGLIAGYIFMGSVLFSVWEEWDWLKAAYYCFITISTIGFGDVVPGSAGFQSTEDQLKMLGAAFYMIFGMAILSMAFNLIQEEIVSKFMWLGEKLGIVEKPKEDSTVGPDELDEDQGKGQQSTGDRNGSRRPSLTDEGGSEVLKPLQPQVAPGPYMTSSSLHPASAYGGGAGGAGPKRIAESSPLSSPRKSGDTTRLIPGSPTPSVRTGEVIGQSHI